MTVEQDCIEGTPIPVPDPANMRPLCMACGTQLSPARARDSKRTTCSPECYKAMMAFRKEMTRQRYCPSCLHPSTPAQREEFKLWRTARGDRQGDRTSGRPSRKHERDLADALKDAIERLDQVRPTIQAEEDLRELDSTLARFRELIAKPA